MLVVQSGGRRIVATFDPGAVLAGKNARCSIKVCHRICSKMCTIAIEIFRVFIFLTKQFFLLKVQPTSELRFEWLFQVGYGAGHWSAIPAARPLWELKEVVPFSSCKRNLDITIIFKRQQGRRTSFFRGMLVAFEE